MRKLMKKEEDYFSKSIRYCKINIGPKIFKNYGIITKEQLDKDLATMKTSWVDEFDILVEFPEEEIKH
jgi:hypothetical protein